MAELTERLENQFDPSPMSVKDWFITILILAIPLVNIVMYLVWAFGSSGNLNRRNFCRATLLWVVIVFAAYIVIFVFAGGSSYMNR
jgi:hypothetical protein